MSKAVTAGKYQLKVRFSAAFKATDAFKSVSNLTISKTVTHSLTSDEKAQMNFAKKIFVTENMHFIFIFKIET